MFISQKKAKLIFRREAGFSVALANQRVDELPKHRDGKREKVKLADVRRIINAAARPSPAPAQNTKTKGRARLLSKMKARMGVNP
jgi:hypothetical protein